MNDCPHDFTERTAHCESEGYCPICRIRELEAELKDTALYECGNRKLGYDCKCLLCTQSATIAKVREHCIRVDKENARYGAQAKVWIDEILSILDKGGAE